MREWTKSNFWLNVHVSSKSSISKVTLGGTLCWPGAVALASPAAARPGTLRGRRTMLAVSG